MQEMQISLDPPKNDTLEEKRSHIETSQTAPHQQSEESKEEKKSDDPIIVFFVRALLMGEALMDDEFVTAVEERMISLLHSGSNFEPGRPLGHFIWKNSVQHSRPRQIVIARAMAFTGLYKGRGLRLNVRKAVERLRAEETKSWKLELYAEVVFATVGLGRDPVLLALHLMHFGEKAPGFQPLCVAPDIKSAFATLQRQAKPKTVNEGRPAKRARKGNGGINSSSSSGLYFGMSDQLALLCGEKIESGYNQGKVAPFCLDYIIFLQSHRPTLCPIGKCCSALLRRYYSLQASEIERNKRGELRNLFLELRCELGYRKLCCLIAPAFCIISSLRPRRNPSRQLLPTAHRYSQAA